MMNNLLLGIFWVWVFLFEQYFESISTAIFYSKGALTNYVEKRRYKVGGTGNVNGMQISHKTE
jgi:hypothetical protein